MTSSRVLPKVALPEAAISEAAISGLPLPRAALPDTFDLIVVGAGHAGPSRPERTKPSRFIRATVTR